MTRIYNHQPQNAPLANESEQPNGSEAENEHPFTEFILSFVLASFRKALYDRYLSLERNNRWTDAELRYWFRLPDTNTRLVGETLYHKMLGEIEYS